MKFSLCLFLVFSCFCAGCIGTDYVDENGFVSQIRITPAQKTIEPGDTTRFAAVYYDEAGEPDLTAAFLWSCTDTTIAMTDQDGLVTALVEGQAHVTATLIGMGITDSARLTVSMSGVLQSRSGMFTGSGNYDVEGTAVLEDPGSGALTLRFEEDFASDNGPGLYVYLSAVSSVNTESLELGALSANVGAQAYSVPTGVGIDDFGYVIIHCKPFNVRFGHAVLQ